MNSLTFAQGGMDLPVWAFLTSQTQNNHTLGQGVQPHLLTTLSNLKLWPSDKVEIGSWFWASTRIPILIVVSIQYTSLHNCRFGLTSNSQDTFFFRALGIRLPSLHSFSYSQTSQLSGFLSPYSSRCPEYFPFTAVGMSWHESEGNFLFRAMSSGCLFSTVSGLASLSQGSFPISCRYPGL